MKKRTPQQRLEGMTFLESLGLAQETINAIEDGVEYRYMTDEEKEKSGIMTPYHTIEELMEAIEAEERAEAENLTEESAE